MQWKIRCIYRLANDADRHSHMISQCGSCMPGRIGTDFDAGQKTFCQYSQHLIEIPQGAGIGMHRRIPSLLSFKVVHYEVSPENRNHKCNVCEYKVKKVRGSEGRRKKKRANLIIGLHAQYIWFYEIAGYSTAISSSDKPVILEINV